MIGWIVAGVFLVLLVAAIARIAKQNRATMRRARGHDIAARAVEREQRNGGRTT